MAGTEITKDLCSICSGSGSRSRTAADLHTPSADALCTSSRSNALTVGGWIGCKGAVKKRKSKLNVGYWNMRTQVEADGGIITAIASNIRT